jgi:hypothetical protein
MRLKLGIQTLASGNGFFSDGSKIVGGVDATEFVIGSCTIRIENWPNITFLNLPKLRQEKRNASLERIHFISVGTAIDRAPFLPTARTAKK